MDSRASLRHSFAMAFDRILLVGCGNMAGAMLDGWLAAGYDPSRFTAVDPVRAEYPAGVRGLAELPRGEQFDAVLLGVKPQMLSAVAADVVPFAGPQAVLFSLLAGVELATLRGCFPQAGGLVRIMPNLAAALGKSPMALAQDGLGADAQEQVLLLLDPLGTPEWIEEHQFDAITALAGSGPAFVYRFIDALARSAAELGLPREQAGRLALAMVEGASALAAASPHDPGELARRVASPGGTTEAGLKMLDDGEAMLALLRKTLRAASDRSAELAAEARRQP